MIEDKLERDARGWLADEGYATLYVQHVNRLGFWRLHPKAR